MTENIDNEALLKTIAENPEAAHFLADLAAGGDLHQLIEEHFGIKPSAINDQEDDDPDDADADDTANDPKPAAAVKPAATVGMYRSQVEPDRDTGDSTPTFLAHLRPDFWGDLPISW
jgi:hypothetical protein